MSGDVPHVEVHAGVAEVGAAAKDDEPPADPEVDGDGVD